MSRFVKVFSVFLFVFFLTQTSMGATYTVNKIADTNDGVCNADCSLREAVGAANGTADNDFIAFDSMVFGTPQTITLSGTEIVIAANGTLTVNGPGANMLTISGGNSSRILATGIGVVATVSGATFTQGTGVGVINSGRGGAIYNVSGDLTLNNVIITGNNAANGGGINNAAATGGGGGVLTINNCIISNNTSTSSGGGMQNFSTSTVAINSSTFTGNSGGSTTGGGGAQFNGTVTITNSTFANNNAPTGAGGGFQSNGTSLVMTNVTVSGNTSATNGGGIHRGTTNANFFIRNSIVSGNNGAAGSLDITNSVGGISSVGNNIIGSVGTSTGWIMSDLLDTNPMLLPLANNGGFGMTYLPMTGSAAINAGQNCVVDLTCATNNPPAAVTTDQRGIVRPQGANVDIGAVEVIAIAANASVRGRAVAPNGSPAGRVLVTISNMSGVIQTSYTNNFGYFAFTGIPTGQTYTLNGISKQYLFNPQIQGVNGDVTGIVFSASSQNRGSFDSKDSIATEPLK